MASFTVSTAQVGVHEKTLSAGIVDTVTFTLGSTGTPGWGRVPKKVEIYSDGAADIYVTLDGSTPVAAAQTCWRLPAQAGATVLTVSDDVPDDAVVVKLISTGTPKYSVSRAG